MPEYLYTPSDGAVQKYLTDLYDAYGSWDRVAVAILTPVRILRRIRSRRNATVTRSMVQRWIDASGYGDTDNFTWYTEQQLLDLGVWAPSTQPEKQGAPAPHRVGMTPAERRYDRKKQRRLTLTARLKARQAAERAAQPDEEQ